jgi:threonine dehydratase
VQHSVVLTRTDVEVAARRIAGHVRRTPVVAVEPVAGEAALWLKLEQLQHAGSFKTRGAFNRILGAAEAAALPDSGVLVASGGNAGLAVAYAARSLGVRAEVFVPTTAPAVKVERLRALDAVVVQAGGEYADALAAADLRAGETGALLCHAYDQPEICAGQGTLALELLADVPDLDTIVVAVGGGGLMAGVTVAAAGRAQVVAVEPTRCPTLSRALEVGEPVDVAVSGVAADALGARRLGEIAFRVATEHDVRSLLVEDDAIVRARRFVWEQWHLVVEHAAATALAPLLDGGSRPRPDERVAVVVCGANTDPADLAH